VNEKGIGPDCFRGAVARNRRPCSETSSTMPPLSYGRLICGSGFSVFRLYWRRSCCVIDLVTLQNSAGTFNPIVDASMQGTRARRQMNRDNCRPVPYGMKRPQTWEVAVFNNKGQHRYSYASLTTLLFVSTRISRRWMSKALPV